ncbi:hypothetical protein IFM89_031650 [Coptis chinensis]|uniref:ABC transporter B family member 26, chloroplastic n=1 Tax=Coptis chinensis TaxID=261450 RepID=A0A835MB87_9MAGN|nr:hypothetical protein IFM89_031650 [Coptis chinensis]
MALLVFNPTFTFSPKQQPIFPIHHTNSHFQLYPCISTHIYKKPIQLKSAFFDEFSVGSFDRGANDGIFENLKKWSVLVREIGYGGSFWNFPEHQQVVVNNKPVTAVFALRRMWDLVANDRWVIYSAFAALVLAALSEISIPHYLTASIFSAQSGSSVVFKGNARLLILLCFTSGICSGLRGCCFSIANMILVKRMREMLYSALLFQDISFFDSETVGDLTSRLGSDCQQVSRVIGNDLNMILRNILQGTGALIYLFILSWPLALSTLAICSVLSTIMLFYGQYQKKAARLTQEFTASANEVTQETFSLIRTVRVYKLWLKKLADISLRQSVAYGFWNLSFNTLYHSTQVIAVLVGGASIMAGHITAEQLTKFILYCEWLIYATWWVGDNLSSLMQSVGASEKAHILQDVNMSIHPNEVVAIVGLSGSGKSTLINLLLRLYEPTNGQILIDGFPLKELDIKWFRERIGFVGQEPRLFRMDVSSNIRYGCNKDINQEDVEFAAKQAYAHEFISSLPDGYKTLVDDDLLSGGQKQRIAIARAILRDPSILILDEATSALDAETEHNVKGILRAAKSGSKKKRTVIVIAHRLSTIQAADRVVVMNEGEIAEISVMDDSLQILPFSILKLHQGFPKYVWNMQTGSHIELLRKDGLYARLTKRQTGALT